MSRFTSHLGVCTLEFSDGRPASRGGLCLFYLAEVLPYEIGDEGSGRILHIPAFDRAGVTDRDIQAICDGRWAPRGVTDFGSVPWFGRWVVAPTAPAAKAFVLHDDGYCARGEDWAEALGRPATRAEVDRELKVALKALGMAAWRRELVYRAVRLGGAGAWGR